MITAVNQRIAYQDNLRFNVDGEMLPLASVLNQFQTLINTINNQIGNQNDTYLTGVTLNANRELVFAMSNNTTITGPVLPDINIDNAVLDPVTYTLTITETDGTTHAVNLQAVVQAAQTVTTLVDNGNGTFTYTNEAGAAVTIDTKRPSYKVIPTADIAANTPPAATDTGLLFIALDANNNPQTYYWDGAAYKHSDTDAVQVEFTDEGCTTTLKINGTSYQWSHKPNVVSLPAFSRRTLNAFQQLDNGEVYFVDCEGNSVLLRENIIIPARENHARILYVNANGDDTTANRGDGHYPYRTISAAIQAADAYDTIKVLGWLMESNITIDKAITLELSDGNLRYDTAAGGTMFIVATKPGENVTIRNGYIFFDGFRDTFLLQKAGSVLYDNVIIDARSGVCHSNPSQENVYVKNCMFLVGADNFIEPPQFGQVMRLFILGYLVSNKSIEPSVNGFTEIIGQDITTDPDLTLPTFIP